MKHTSTGTQTSTPALGVRITLAIAALSVIAIVAGCGGDGADNRASATVPSPAASTSTGGGTVAATNAALVTPAATSGGRVITLGDSLPPDVNATVEDSLAAPGEVVAITAQGSDDVSQIGLSDGLGRMQLFTRDPASNAWQVLYRVPLRTKRDRLALSVTALNDVNRWRRVWVFVNVQQAAEADSDEVNAEREDLHHE
jgi:hypothetical protein